MNGYAASKTLALAAISVAALCAGAWRAEAGFLQTDLVSDIPGLGMITDSNLMNTWGVSHLPGSPFWISNQVTDTASLYTVTGSTGVSTPNLFPGNTVAIPTTASGPQGPTGQVANPGTSFNITGGPALFMFANLNGTISAWNLSNVNHATNPATVEVTTPGALYTGLAINQADTLLYAANDNGAGSINVFNGSFTPVSLGAGAFATPSAIKALGLVVFNVQDINGSVYVTYAPAGHAAQTVATAGEGAVAVFSEAGVLQRMMVGGNLASPWGVALAPASFGRFGGDLLVGNFSFVDSEINAFDPTTGAFEGDIKINPGAGNTPGGLWDLTFGGGGTGSPFTLYFTDGINGEHDGLFGAIDSIPEPSTWVMMFAGFVGLGLLAAARRRRSPATIV
jgi:uncharacterized protein (TIGR03118 family)